MADAEGLFAANHSRLFRYFCRAVGRAETARDLTQEVFLRVSRTAIREDADGDLSGLAVSHRQESRARPSPQRGCGTRSRWRWSMNRRDPRRRTSTSPSTRPSPRCPTLDRDVFLMREVAGLGYEEIATACELTPDAVRNRIHRTRLLLREQLAAPIATSRTMATSRSVKIYGSPDQ